MGAGGVKIGIARHADMHHRWYFQLAEFLVKRIPVTVGQRRRGPVSARWIGVEIASDEAELVDAAFELRDTGFHRNARALRQLADADEIVRKQIADAIDAIVGQLRPLLADLEVADMMSHARRAR